MKYEKRLKIGLVFWILLFIAIIFQGLSLTFIELGFIYYSFCIYFILLDVYAINQICKFVGI